MKIKKKLKQYTRSHEKVPTEGFPELTCQNCSLLFKGRFCPSCGQAVNEFDKPISFILYNFVGDFFSFDTRFLKTFYYLILKPGFLTDEFFRGHRVRYAPPLRIFIFASFILFLLLQIYTDRGFKRTIDPGKISEITKLPNDSAASIVFIPGQSKKDLSDRQGENEKIIINLNYETFGNATNLKMALNNYADQFEAKAEKITDPEKKESMKKIATILRIPEQLVARILKYISWTFFLLLPVFALILKIFYNKKKQFYIRHLIFSVHLHSFIFIVFTVITILYFLFSTNIKLITIGLILCIPFYFIIALKHFYGQGLGRTILKSMVMTLLYNIVSAIIIWIVLSNVLGFS